MDRKYILNMIEKYTYKDLNKPNLVGLITLKQLGKTKIKIINNDINKDYHNISGYCLNKSTIVLISKYIDNDEFLMMTCVHEINHLLNWDLGLSQYKKEFIAFVAEEMFMTNSIDLTVDTLNIIKKKLVEIYPELSMKKIKTETDYKKGIIF